jgi:hypothetical protein
MHPLKIARLTALAKKVKKYDPMLSQELTSLVIGAQNRTAGLKKIAMTPAIRELKKVMEGKRYVVIGGVAIRYWVQSRTTEDIDIAVMVSTLTKLRETLDLEVGMLCSTTVISGTTVDFLDSSNFPWTQNAIRTAEMSDLGVPVAKPEYLILYKLQALREKDIDDIKNLLKLDGIYEKSKVLVLKYFGKGILEELDALKAESDYGL